MECEPSFKDPAVCLYLQPLDTLFDGEGRPFGAKDRVLSRPLPLPQTIYGMIRTWLKQQCNVQVMKNLRNSDHPNRWIASVAVRGPWFARRAGSDGRDLEVFVSLPSNIMQKGKDEDADLVRLDPLDNAGMLPGWNQARQARDLKDVELRPLLYRGSVTDAAGHDISLEKAEGYLNAAGLQAYLDGKCPTRKQCLASSEIYEFEERTGIAVDPSTLSSEDGAIYSTRHIRLKENYGLYVELGIESRLPELSTSARQLEQLIPDEGLLFKLGGERRLIHASKVKRFIWQQAKGNGRYTTLLITPAVYEPPEGSSRETWQPPLMTQLVGAAVAKPIPLSGWSLNRDESGRSLVGPKPMRYAIPAGTVYYWEMSKRRPDDPAPVVTQICEHPQTKAAGWGYALCGTWNNRNGNGNGVGSSLQNEKTTLNNALKEEQQ